jgi:hypothetical protein
VRAADTLALELHRQEEERRQRDDIAGRALPPRDDAQREIEDVRALLLEGGARLLREPKQPRLKLLPGKRGLELPVAVAVGGRDRFEGRERGSDGVRLGVVFGRQRRGDGGGRLLAGQELHRPPVDGEDAEDFGGELVDDGEAAGGGGGGGAEVEEAVTAAEVEQLGLEVAELGGEGGGGHGFYSRVARHRGCLDLAVQPGEQARGGCRRKPRTLEGRARIEQVSDGLSKTRGPGCGERRQ